MSGIEKSTPDNIEKTTYGNFKLHWPPTDDDFVKVAKYAIDKNKENPFAYEMFGSLFFIDNNYEKASTNYYKAIQKFNKLNISTPSNIKLSLAKSLIEMKDKNSLKKS